MTEYGRTLYCDAANSRPLREDSTEAKGMGFKDMVVAGGTRPSERKGDSGGRSGRERGGGKEKRSSGRKLRAGTEYRAYNVVH